MENFRLCITKMEDNDALWWLMGGPGDLGTLHIVGEHSHRIFQGIDAITTHSVRRWLGFVWVQVGSKPRFETWTLRDIA